MAKPFDWDFEPRNVAFKLSLRATFHPSVGGCTVSIPWLDASGALSAPVTVGPLNTCDPEPSQPGPGGRGARRVTAEKELGSLPVTLDLVKAIQTAKLPVSISADGDQTVAGGARLNLGPLLLAGSSALSPDMLRPGEPARSKRLRPSNAVFASWTDTIGVAGLYSIEISISTDVPLLSPEMLQRLMPACFKVEMVRGLPNEPWLPKHCKDIYVEVYPKLSSGSEGLREACPRMQSESRPHNTMANFCEPMVWLLGLAPPHAVREWMQHEGLVVEIHDRDPLEKPVLPPSDAESGEADMPAEVKKALHGHGVARFQLGPLLDLGCKRYAQGKEPDSGPLPPTSLELSLRADVCPCRGDKKKRRADAMAEDSLRASGLLDEEGRQRMARRAGLDKREDTSNYHALGTVCTIRAALAAPIPTHFEIQEEEEDQHRGHWESTEELQDGNVYRAKAMARGTEASGLEPTAWAPKASPYRAKVADIAGPWRKKLEDAKDDERRIMEEAGEDLAAPGADLSASQAVASDLAAEAPKGAKGGLDCRYERFGRIVLTLVDKTDTEVNVAVLSEMRKLNAGVLGLDPLGGEFLVRQLSEEEQVDPHLDLLTGFCVLDGQMRIIIIEGLRDGHSFPELLKAIPRGPEAPKLLHNPVIGFGERLYAEFGPRLKHVKVRGSLDKLACRPNLYSWSRSSSEADLAGNEAPKQLMDLKALVRLRGVRESTHFPKAAQIAQVELLYGAYVSDQELEGYPEEEAITVKNKKKATKSAVGSSQSSKAEGSIHSSKVEGDPRSPSAGKDKADFLQDAISMEEISTLKEASQRFQNRKQLKAPTDQGNAHFEATVELRRSASVQDFGKTNKTLVRQQSDANVRMNDMLGKKRERETPFIEGQVYLYSSQKLNSAELQKDWMRKHMDQHASNKMWSYNPAYFSQSFDFSGAQPPGIRKHQPSCPSDTYARLPGDERDVFRTVQSRPKEAFRRPPRDLDQSTIELLHEPFEENEWHQLAVGDERRRPIAIEEHFDHSKVPHQRRHTTQPFNSQKMLLKPGSEFGPKSQMESVHYHGRRPDEHRDEQYLHANLKEREEAQAKVRAHRNMRSFSQTQTRTGPVDLDRHERLLKDQSSYPLRGRVDARHPETMRTAEVFHELGRPDHEFQARLRENDASPPLNVNTGAYLKRDHEVGTGVKRSCMSGSMTRAPWRHDGGTTKIFNVTSKGQVEYGSQNDFRCASQAPKSRVCEDQLWKTASRTNISQKERSQSTGYLRPQHYGVQVS